MTPDPFASLKPIRRFVTTWSKGLIALIEYLEVADEYNLKFVCQFGTRSTGRVWRLPSWQEASRLGCAHLDAVSVAMTRHYGVAAVGVDGGPGRAIVLVDEPVRRMVRAAREAA